MGTTKTKYELKPKAQDPSYRRIMGNYPSKKYKSNPTVLRLSFEFTGGTTQFIDIAKALSIVNRRLYRQGCYYYVDSVELYNAEDAYVDLHVVPDNWVTRSSYRRAKSIWDDMNQKALMHTPTIAPKYHDFKVYMSDLHRTTGSADPSLYDVNSLKTVYSADDWNYSQFVSADDDQDAAANADEFYAHFIGGHSGSSANWTSIGIVKSYAKTRVHPDTSGSPVLPSVITDDPLLNLMDYSSEEQLNDIVTNMNLDNDETPYDADAYVGETAGSMQQVARLVTADPLLGGRRVDMAAGFCAPCGLICVDPQATSTAFRLVVNVTEGPYHGTYAERMV